MVTQKKKTDYTDEQKESAYNAYATYNVIIGNNPTKEKFDKYRYRKYFYLLAEKWDTYATRIPLKDYITYIIENQIPFKNWGDISRFKEFLLIYIKQEDCQKAIKRSLEYLEEKGQDIHTISETRLTIYVEGGNVSPWLILKEYPEFFDYIHKETKNSFVQNIMTPYFWKLQAQKDQVN